MLRDSSRLSVKYTENTVKMDQNWKENTVKNKQEEVDEGGRVEKRINKRSREKILELGKKMASKHSNSCRVVVVGVK